MKFRITLKDPDGIYEGVEDAVNKTRPTDVTDGEWEDIKSRRMSEITGQWFEYGDYCEIEIDTDAKTARVVPVKESSK